MNKVKDLYSEKFDKLNDKISKLSYHNAAEGSNYVAETKERFQVKKEITAMTTELVGLGVTLEEFRQNTSGGLFRLSDLFTAKAWEKIKND